MSVAAALPEALKSLLPASLQGLAENVRLSKGTLLFAQGRRPAAIFYVVRGEVVLERVGLRGESVVLQRVRNGFVAEASMQSGRYHCDGRVTLPGVAVRLPLDAVKEALARDAAFAMGWIAMLNQEIRRLRAQTERLALRGVDARLLHLIETEGKCGRLKVDSGLKSVAAQLTVSHEALYRTLARLERDGQLRREEGCLVIATRTPHASRR